MDFEIMSAKECNDSVSENIKSVLSKDKLEEATCFVFICDFDGNPYNYYLKCFFSINEVKAEITIYFGVDFLEQYEFKKPIKIDEYNNFLRDLETQDIRNVTKEISGFEGILDESSIDLSSPIIMGGRQSSSLFVKKGEELLFNGIVGKNLCITKGQLEDSFIKYLPQYMKDAILVPEKFLNDCKLPESIPDSLSESAIEGVINEKQIILNSSLFKETNSDNDELLV